MTIRALLPLAHGVEEMEAVIVVDVLRRAQWDVTAAAVETPPILASRGMRLLPDADWADIQPLDFDVLIIPGGAKGADFLRRDPRVLTAIRDFSTAGKLLAAICSGALALHSAGVIQHRRVTSYPTVAQQMPDVNWINEPVVQDGRIITSQGPATAFRFALALVENLSGAEQARTVAKGLLLDTVN